MAKDTTEPLIIAITFLWSGMIVGISFLESWIKFKTPTLTKSVGLDVGRTVFRAFHKTQYGLMSMLILMGLLVHLLLWRWLILASIVLILALQGLWLFPYLNSCVDRILAGNQPPKSLTHCIYGVLEMIKLGLLIWFAFLLMTVRLNG